LPFPPTILDPSGSVFSNATVDSCDSADFPLSSPSLRAHSPQSLKAAGLTSAVRATVVLDDCFMVLFLADSRRARCAFDIASLSVLVVPQLITLDAGEVLSEQDIDQFR
jgi:hypothetical protein